MMVAEFVGARPERSADALERPRQVTPRRRWLLAGSLSLCASAATTLADELDDYVRAQMERQKIPGLSIAICREGQVVRAQGYGLANVEHQVPAKPETVYQSGSVGKQFTATAVMMLVEEGKLALDEPITRYFDGAPEAWKAITVRHLLTHSSGIKDWEGGSDLDMRRDYAEDELLKVAYGLVADFAPGTQWSYSNTGYALLGFLLRKASGRFYGDLLQERVFGPLGMTATRIISEADIVPNRAAGYQLEKGVLKNQEWVSPSINTTADGSLYFTVLDLAKWDAALNGERLLTKASLQQMWTPVRLASGASFPYGFGWSIDEQRGHMNIEHGGSWQGFRTSIARYVEDGLSVIVLANLAQADPELITHGVAGLVEPSLRLPDLDSRVPDPDAALSRRVREVLVAWSMGESSRHMAPALRAASAGTAREKADRKRTSERLEKQTSFSFLGEDDLSRRRLERRGETIARIAHYALVAGDGRFAYRFYLTREGNVADFAAEQR